MNKKKALTICVLVMLFVGVGFVLTPFFGALKPNKKAEAALARINLSPLKLGEFISLEHPRRAELHSGYVWHVLFYRKKDGTVRAWDIPKKGEFVGMPDLHWWQPRHDCLNFGPTAKDGSVDETKPITCHDKKLPSEWWRSEWKWDIDGNRLGVKSPNLQKTKGVMQADTFVFGRDT